MTDVERAFLHDASQLYVKAVSEQQIAASCLTNDTQTIKPVPHT